jgi:predicted dehydrogenase
MKPTRRQFAQAAAAIATAHFPILGANDRIRIGQVGLGGRGTDHVNFYSQIGPSECQTVAICDVNQTARERASALVRKLQNVTPKEYNDMREMFDSKDIDAVSITTPNHWHALATIWACQAGKDVYIEKPACHNVFEGRQMVAAARKYNRMVQVGSQSRTIAHKVQGIQQLKEGAIGQIYHVRGICYRRRFSIGHTPDEPVPPGLDWERFLGPAQLKPYSKNKFAYNWHWFWDTGNGDIGNQGIHEMDICAWALGRSGWPVSVSSSGGKYVWKDDQETANTQQTTFDYGDMQVTFDVRNLPTPPESLVAGIKPNWAGNLFFGENGFMVMDGAGYQMYKSTVEIKGEATTALGASAGSKEKYQQVSDEKMQEARQNETTGHMKNFLDSIRARDHHKLHADVAVGTRSAAFVHLANISLRLGRTLRMDQSSGRIVGDDQANSMLSRDYREPYIVPRQV